MASYARIDHPTVTYVLFNHNGPVGLDLKKRAKIMASYARKDAPVGRPGNGHKPGKLKRSIRVAPLRKVPKVGQMARIGTYNVPYAIFVHEGTRAHRIKPKYKKVLAFEATKKGGIVKMSKNGGRVITQSVNHPGTRPNRFLKNNIKWLYTSR